LSQGKLPETVGRKALGANDLLIDASQLPKLIKSGFWCLDSKGEFQLGKHIPA